MNPAGTTPNRPVSPLLKADPKATLTFSAEKDGSLRVTYQNWEEAKVFRPGERVEVVAEGGQVRAYRRGSPLVGPAPDAYRDWDGTPEPETIAPQADLPKERPRLAAGTPLTDFKIVEGSTWEPIGR